MLGMLQPEIIDKVKHNNSDLQREEAQQECCDQKLTTKPSTITLTYNTSI